MCGSAPEAVGEHGNDTSGFLGTLLPLAAVAYVLGQRKATAVSLQGRQLHSRPRQYGLYVAVWMVLPAVAIGIVAYGASLLGLHVPSAPFLIALSMVGGAIGLSLALKRVAPGLRARVVLERVVRWSLLAASLISILTTLGIVVSIIVEAFRFFSEVSILEFITGTTWAPGIAKPHFGSIPLFVGTFIIAIIAMCLAIPVGLFAAIFMCEYASPGMRSLAKPLLEVLAGIPTVVYGFFAAITISPLVVQIASAVGLDAAYTNALAPGLVMGIMIIPFISSLSDDVIHSVPNSLREGSYALGATKSETIKKVILPAAFPGITAAALLGVSRALGETMIVVMAAGLRPNLTANPLEAMTTVTVRIVDALTGDQAFNSPETLSAFALGLVLFVITLTLNLVSIVIIRKFRQNYE